MKNKILFIGSLCLMVAFGLVIGSCQNEVQTVEFATVGAPKNVTATYVAAVTSGANPKDAHIKVTWDVNVNPDVEWYAVVYQQDGKKNYIKFEDHDFLDGQWFVHTDKYAMIDNDKWDAEVKAWALPKGTFRIGVVSYSRRNDRNESKPAWAPTTVVIP